jgi:hypothetical protein
LTYMGNYYYMYVKWRVLTPYDVEGFDPI